MAMNWGAAELAWGVSGKLDVRAMKGWAFGLKLKFKLEALGLRRGAALVGLEGTGVGEDAELLAGTAFRALEP